MIAARSLPLALRAERAAVYAKDQHVTRAKAAALFLCKLEEVDAAFATLYPDSGRVRT